MIEGLERRAQQLSDAAKPEAVTATDLQMPLADAAPELAATNSRGEVEEVVEGKDNGG